MIIFRCTVCHKVNILFEGQQCAHCDTNEAKTVIAGNSPSLNTESMTLRSEFSKSSEPTNTPMTRTEVNIHRKEAAVENVSVLSLEALVNLSLPTFGDCLGNSEVKTLHFDIPKMYSKKKSHSKDCDREATIEDTLLSKSQSFCNNTIWSQETNRCNRITTDNDLIDHAGDSNVAILLMGNSILKQSEQKKKETILDCQKRLKRYRSTEFKQNKIDKLDFASSSIFLPLHSTLDISSKVFSETNESSASHENDSSLSLSDKRSDASARNLLLDDSETEIVITQKKMRLSQHLLQNECMENVRIEKLVAENSDARIVRKVFPCPECNIKFANESILSTHKLTHIHYKCDRCDKQCPTEKNLTIHMLKHRDHNCDQCGKYFSKISQLKYHYVVHSKEKPFKCEQCHFTSKRERCLKVHVKTMHRK